MREILFRGYDPIDKVWIRGCDSIYFVPDPPWDVVLANSEARRKYHVDKESVGQYTGIQDNRGRYIYEGDILYPSWNKDERWIVEFRYGCFVVEEVGHEANYYPLCSNWFRNKSFVVCGQKYEPKKEENESN